MLRKEILGTKVRTESGLNKPLTLVKPNNDEDYKNQEFLDTDILLAKDIKRFVKGGGANGDSVGVEYIYETSDANAVFTNKLIIDTCPINKDGTYDQTIQLTTRNSEIEFGSIKIGLSEMGFGITVDNNAYITDGFGNKFDYRGPLHAGGSQNQYWTMLTDLSEYKINDGKWDNCIHNDGIFPINAPFLFCDPNFKEDNSIFRYAYQTDFTNIETDCRNSYRYDVTEKSCIVDSLVVDYNNNGTNTYYNVGGIKSTKQYQSGSKVFATDGSIVDLPVSQKPLFSYIQSTYYEESMAFTEGVYKHFCIYSTQTNHDNIYIGAHYYISPSSAFGYTLYAGKHVMWPFYEQKLELNGEYYRYKYDLRNIVGIHSDNSTKIGYYKSDGTIVSTESLKQELGISDSTSDTTQSIISYMNKNNDTNNRVVVLGRSDFAMCVYGGSNVSNMYIGNYVFSSTHDYKNYYVPVGDNKYTSDNYIFPMVDCIQVHESGVYNHYCYNLRNITGIKSDDGNIGYYRSDGNITNNVSFEPQFQIDGSNNPSGPWVGISYDGTGINAYAFTSGEITICPFENPANEPILSYTQETMCTGSKLKFEVTLNNIEHIVSRYNAGEDKVYATDGSIYDLGKLIDDIENTLIDLTNRIAALEAKQ